MEIDRYRQILAYMAVAGDQDCAVVGRGTYEHLRHRRIAGTLRKYEQRHKRIRNLHEDSNAVCLNERRITDELQRIAFALLGVQQNRAAGERRTIPKGLPERRRCCPPRWASSM